MADGAHIPRFYAGRSVLITGATGFMGKVLVERLLSSCPHVSALHLLVRSKRGTTPEQRLQELRASPAFDVLRRNDPDQLNKIHVVSGDTSQPGLGLSDSAMEQIKEVSVIFHCAATVKFNESLSRAVELNVLSVTRLLDVVDRLPNVAAFVHVSTAYSNVEQLVTEERVYPLPRPLHRMIEDVMSAPDGTSDEDVKRYISPKPNTYTFTKMLAETAVLQHGNKGYPLAIFRPTIVISSLQHPFPGWVENHNGPSGVALSIGQGLVRVFPCAGEAKADLLPVDLAIDTLIAVAWETAVDNLSTVRVYNCSTNENPTTWKQLRQVILHQSRLRPAPQTAWYPFCVFISNRLLYNVLSFLMQTIPMHIVEYILRFCNCKKRIDYIKLSSRLHTANDALRYFAVNERRFITDNVQKLRARMSEADRKIYNLDPHTIDWEDCLEKFMHGCRKHLVNSGEDSIPAARKRLLRMYVIHRSITILLPMLIMKCILDYVTPNWTTIAFRLVTQLINKFTNVFKG